MFRTNANYLRWKLGKWARDYAPNVSMFDGSFATDFLLEPNEIAIAQISLASGGSPIVVTDLRLLRDQQTLLRYDDLRYCIWIDRDREMKVKLKESHFQRIILERHDESEIVLDGPRAGRVSATQVLLVQTASRRASRVMGEKSGRFCISTQDLRVNSETSRFLVPRNSAMSTRRLAASDLNT
jgi:hypothetical protein